MGILSRWRVAVLVFVVAGIALTSCEDSTDSVSDTNKILSAIDLPVLPVGVVDARVWTGGVFAKYVNIKFGASPEQALSYLKAGEVPYYFEFSAAGRKAHISTTHVLNASHDATGDQTAAEERLWRQLYARKWFQSVFGIKHGWFYFFHKDKDMVACHFYYDLGGEGFYVYWTYN